MAEEEGFDVIDMMAMDAAGAQDAVPEGEKRSIREVIEAARALELEVEAAELALKGKKSELAKLKQRVLPKMLDLIGTNTFTFELEDGTEVGIAKEFKVSGTLSKAAKGVEDAIAYLQEEGLKDSVKTVLSMEFLTTEGDLADKAEADIKALGNGGREVVRVQTIAPATLASFGRQRKKQNPKFDFERVGLTAFTQVKFTSK